MLTKRKKIFFVLLYFLILSIVLPQTNLSIDSDQNETELMKANRLLDSCWAIRTKNPHLALQLANNALKIIDENNFQNLKPKTLNFLGVINRKLGNLEKSFFYFNNALSLANLLKDSVQIGFTYNNLTDCYIKKASYSIALEKVLIAYQIFEKLRHQTGIAYSFNYLGEIYIHHKDYDKALSYLKKAADIRYAQNDLRGYSNTITNIGTVYYELKEYDKAMTYFYKAIKINNTINYLKGNSRVISHIGDISFVKNEFQNALLQIKESLKIDKKIENKAGIITNYNKLGLIYLKLNNYKLAKESLNKAITLAKESGHLDQEMLSYLYLSQYYSTKNKYKKALENLTKYIVLKDSIYSQENMGRFADLQTLFATNRKELENKMLKKEIEFEKRTNTYFAIIFVITLLIILLLISKYKTQNKANNLLKELNSSKDKFFSILAHDLKNPFQGLLGYTELLKEDFDLLTQEEIKQSIDSLYNVTRNVYSLLEGLLEWSRAQTGRMEYNPTLFKLSEVANKVIELLKENANAKNISLSTEIDDSILVFADRNMVNTILRNLVANGIKFANDGNYIKIIAEKKNNEVKISVIDNGIGMSPEELNNLFRIDVHHTTLGTKGEEGTGVGLILCKELVKNNGGEIWAESELGKGSKFIFTLPNSKK